MSAPGSSRAEVRWLRGRSQSPAVCCPGGRPPWPVSSGELKVVLMGARWALIGGYAEAVLNAHCRLS